jgi:hypothetical protein
MNGRQRRSGWQKAGIIVPLVLLILLVALVPGLGWLRTHPGANPWAQLEISDAPGWATHRKLSALHGDHDACRALLDRADVPYQSLPAVGSGRCLAADRTRIGGKGSGFALSPATVAPSCAVSAGMLIWMRHVVQPAAQRHFGKRVTMVENLGSYNCRQIAGRETMSEHASGNAIDISAFVLADGERIVLTRDWDGRPERSAFLRDVRDGACGLFSTVLSPDYNAAHRDHFHLDMAERVAGWGVCR